MIHYLGKSFVNPPDPVHFYIRGNRNLTNNTKVNSKYPITTSGMDFDHMTIDEEETRSILLHNVGY